jgi:hypothetical protein
MHTKKVNLSYITSALHICLADSCSFLILMTIQNLTFMCLLYVWFHNLADFYIVTRMFPLYNMCMNSFQCPPIMKTLSAVFLIIFVSTCWTYVNDLYMSWIHNLADFSYAISKSLWRYHAHLPSMSLNNSLCFYVFFQTFSYTVYFYNE